MNTVARTISNRLLDLLAEEQVIVIQGPRAVGKTTTLRELQNNFGGSVVDLADDAALRVARQDPAGYVQGLNAPVLIDEFQRLPELVSVVKRAVDQTRLPGQFVLTGSTTSALLPKGTETLAGRSHDITLWGFSQGEMDGVEEDFLVRAFAEPQQFWGRPRSLETRSSYVERITRGGFPEAVRRERESARHRWHLDYAKRVVERDLVELVRLRSPMLLRGVLKASAARTAQITNLTDLGDELGAGRQMVTTYVELLERVFLVDRLPAWSRNFSARISKHPKLHVTDSGLAASLLNLGSVALKRHPMVGALMESFVVNELRKQQSWATNPVEMFHFRHRDGHEVDIILEDLNGQIIGIEVKSASSVDSGDIQGLRFLADRLGGSFRHGFVLYTGDASVRLGDDRFSAIPISSLWATALTTLK
jgi:uncharacterized protein